MRDSLRALGRKINWWLGLAGNVNLVLTFIIGGAAATVLTTLLVFVMSFIDWVLGIPLFFRVMFFASVFVLSFALTNHARQRLPGWWARRGRITDEELKERCLKLSQEIYEFVGDRDKGEPGNRYSRAIQRARDDEERQRLHDEYSKETLDYSDETRHRYEQKFATEMAWVAEGLERRGWLDSGEAWKLQHVTNKMQMRDVARVLGAACGGRQ